jgi:hypothetical protein
MNQALYAHMNNKRKMKKKKEIWLRCLVGLGEKNIVKSLLLLNIYVLSLHHYKNTKQK